MSSQPTNDINDASQPSPSTSSTSPSQDSAHPHLHQVKSHSIDATAFHSHDISRFSRVSVPVKDEKDAAVAWPDPHAIDRSKMHHVERPSMAAFMHPKIEPDEEELEEEKREEAEKQKHQQEQAGATGGNDEDRRAYVRSVMVDRANAALQHTESEESTRQATDEVVSQHVRFADPPLTSVPDTPSSASPPPRAKTPLQYYIILALAILAISCAGTLLRKLSDTPPFLKAFWRLFFISWYLSIGFVYQYRTTTDEIRQKFWLRSTQIVLLGAGIVTSFHFATWIWSLQHTSLAHSLFFVCSHPIVIIFIMLAQGVHVTRLEWLGVGAGLLGSVLMLVDDGTNTAESDATGTNGVAVTWQGDLLAFLGALGMVGYLYAGKHCRTWLPLFLYAFPVTFIAAFPLLILSLASEDVTFVGANANSVFGFLGGSSIGIMLLIVIGPGIIGHLGINCVLSHISPLAISITITLEPIFGVIIGLASSVEDAPHALTIVGGPLTLIGCILAVYGAYLREKWEVEEEERRRYKNIQQTSDDRPLDIEIARIQDGMNYSRHDGDRDSLLAPSVSWNDGPTDLVMQRRDDETPINFVDGTERKVALETMNQGAQDMFASVELDAL